MSTSQSVVVTLALPSGDIDGIIKDILIPDTTVKQAIQTAKDYAKLVSTADPGIEGQLTLKHTISLEDGVLTSTNTLQIPTTQTTLEGAFGSQPK